MALFTTTASQVGNQQASASATSNTSMVSHAIHSASFKIAGASLLVASCAVAVALSSAGSDKRSTVTPDTTSTQTSELKVEPDVQGAATTESSGTQTSGSASNGGGTTVQMTVNGNTETVAVPENGSVQRSVTSNDGNVSLDVSSNTLGNGTNNSFSSTNLNVSNNSWSSGSSSTFTYDIGGYTYP